MRAVLDTNIFVSAMLSTLGPPARIIDAWQAGRFELVTSAAQIDEFKRSLRYDRLRPYVSRSAAGRIVNGLRARAVVLKRLRIGVEAPDPGDAHLVATALASGADFLVTGDEALLAMKRVGTTRVISARDFAATLAR
ncbi:MAG: putative toxin-antitoxin system toxin component, PIN family [Betaproteobacteria bacterium]|nr:putative toxin-antitoxin system toxin component, PIN family [Betaproteobacteria bacterium]MBI2958991.1 putative toxin-antitoxin system toxin component, PIN family [Betaproteobacteria bacterium]